MAVQKPVVREDYKTLTHGQLKKAYGTLASKYERMEKGAYCPYCDEHKPKEMFYKSYNPLHKSGVIGICKACLYKIATNFNEVTKETDISKESIMKALKEADLPFIHTLYESAFAEVTNEASGKAKNNIWTSYIKNIQSLHQYQGMTWEDGDVFKKGYADVVEKEKKKDKKNIEMMEQYEINKKDVIHAIGYDPFASYPQEDDKPILYAQLVSFIDEDTRNDGMKMSAVIQIVKKLNQAEKLNDQIDKILLDEQNPNNVGVIAKLSSSSKSLIDTANALAKDNGISVNFNNNKSKGASTLSGKIKKLTEIGLRSAEINGFDIGTCKGMQQVAEISEEARHKQIGYDDSIASEIKDIKVELVEKLTKERDKAVEEARLLLLENKDLKDFLKEKNLMTPEGKVVS